MTSPKYNRTPHLPWSPGKGNDDKVATSIETLLNRPLVITEKLDGSNCSIERDGVFARTHAHAPMHASFDRLKAFHATIKHILHGDVQIFGENLFAVHSITYNALPAYFLVFGVRILGARWQEPNEWASWDRTEEIAASIGVPTVPVLWRGSVSSGRELEDLTLGLVAEKSVYGDEREGVVVRVASDFLDEDFPNCVQKLVRKGHVQTSEHWAHKEIVKNGLT